MKKRLSLILTLLLALVVQVTFAQQKQVTGTVSDQEGMPLPGVNVLVKDTSRGTMTDFDGNYSIEVSVGETLVFSFLGFETVEHVVGTNSQINVQLGEDAAVLEEVVVVGYGTRSTVKETSSASVVSSEQLEDRPIASVNDLLKGNASGIFVAGGSGQPGAATTVRIRGISSLNAGTQPLYVVDGVPVISGDYSRLNTTADVLASMNSNDIASVTVLKDASATAQYGARAANGVILITTKSGRSGAPKFNLSYETGFNEKAVEGEEVLSAAQWGELVNEGLVNVLGQDYATYYEDVVNPNGVDTNWGEAIERKSAFQQQTNFSITGGSDKLKYFTSLGYFDQQSTVKNSFFNRTSGRIKVDYDLSDKITLSQNINASFTNLKSLPSGGGFANPLLNKYFARPSDPLYNEDGSYFIGTNLANPRLSNGLFNVPMLLENDFRKAKTLKLSGITTFSYDILDNLNFTTRLSLDNTQIEEDSYNNPRHGDGFSVTGRGYQYDTRVFDYVLQNMLSYDFTLSEDHNFNVLLVQEAQRNNYRSVSAAAEGYGKEGFYTVSVGSNDLTAAGTREGYTNAAYLASVGYDFSGKYTLDLSYRREGNSNFAENNKWGNFWSVGGAWDIAREDFMTGSDLNELKLRASYGQVGNASIGSTSSLAYFSFGGEYNGRIPLYVGGVANPDLTWEVNKPLNFGLDFGVFNNRISGSFDYFIKKTDDLLYAIPLSLATGESSKWVNVGSLENRGWEATLGGRIFEGDFQWNSRLNVSKVENELTDLLENDVISGTKILREGESINTFYLRKWAGVDPETGNPTWYVNGVDGETTNVYNQAQRATQGKSLPSYTGGFSNNFSYKGFTLETLLTFALDYNVYDSWASYMLSGGVYTLSYPGYARQLDRWQEPGDIAENPRMLYNTGNQNNATSTRFMYEGDHIRLANVQLGYDFSDLLGGDTFSALHLYVRGTNILTHAFDEDLNWDPETRSSGLLDLDLPPLKTYTVGVKVSF